MVVEVDERSGFCFGVRNAVEIAGEALSRGEKVFSLGPIVHNDIEVERLSALGLLSVNHDEFKKLKNCKVLIRAHGEPPETYEIALRNNITIIEATCPIVKRLQSRIKETWKETKKNGQQVVIFGKAGHAEVIGLLGQTNNEAILLNGKEDLDKIDFSRDVHLFSQTTMSVNAYNDLAESVITKMKEHGIPDPEGHLHKNNTICGQVSNRQPRLKAFAKKHDVLIFVSGRESSNGKMLFNVCKNENPNTWFVSSPQEIKKEWFLNRNSVGICGATSTPKWLIDKIKDTILSI
ncbi:MAG: 4-hydroxy-3-methylbut-2-enyl diphosphate reductase [Odoribacter sp.]|nr:4-hydroxy-3-methylbut-2-enyl diphosphate reductase [Odoribacter sp.]